MKTRSVDDIRNYWSLKLLPLLIPHSKINSAILEWTDQDDKDLLTQIASQEVEGQNDIDFDDLNNGRASSENKARWLILLKGLGGMMPGQRVLVSQIALKIVHDIETKHERYVPWADPRNGNNRTGRN